MKQEDFLLLLERRISATKSTLSSKNADYAPGEEKLYNFKQGAKFIGCSPTEACAAFMTKHTVSVYDLVNDHAVGKEVKQEKIDEKIGDLICYLILLEACMKDSE